MIVNFLIALLAALGCFSIVMLLLWGRRSSEQEQIKDRMLYLAGVEASLNNSRGARQRTQQVQSLAARGRRLLRLIAAYIEKVEKNNNLDIKMQQAAWPFLGSEFQVIMLLTGAFIGAVLGLLTLQLSMLFMGFIAGVFGCMLVLSIRIQRRRAAFMNQLGDMLNMIANALRAGFSFTQAMEHVAREMDDPVRFEVNKVVRDISVGVTMEDALNSMTRRVQSPDFNLVVSAVLIQRQVGGNLAQILDVISETINERIRMRREVSALTAQGRMSGIILVALPFALAALLQAINPHYLEPLFNEPLGRMAIGGVLVMMLIGCLVIRKIVDIDM